MEKILIEVRDKIMTEAEQYFSFANNSINKESRFTANVICNTIIKSLEKYFIGFLLSKDIVPRSQNLFGLYRESHKHLDLSELSEEHNRILGDLCSTCYSLDMKDAEHKEMIELFEILTIVRDRICSKEMV